MSNTVTELIVVGMVLFSLLVYVVVSEISDLRKDK